jgi:hypothetical protein
MLLAVDIWIFFKESTEFKFPSVVGKIKVGDRELEYAIARVFM